MQWIRIQLSQKKKRKATGQHGKQKDRGRPPGGSFLKVILMSSIEFQNVFPMINFDVWDRLGHVQTIFDTVGL